MPNRRRFCTAAAATLAVGAAPAPGRLFASGPLADNPAAQQFDRLPRGLGWPRVRVLADGGGRWASELTGKSRIVALWAEWCTPCLRELPELAGLQQRCGGAGFEVVSLLTSSRERLNLAGAQARLARAGAGGLPSWVELHGGDVVFGALAVQADGHAELPCSLLVDAGGRVRGRAFGAAPADPAAMNALVKSFRLGPGGRVSRQDMDRYNAAKLGTVWSTPAADAFAKALAEGALDGVPA